MKKNKDIIIAFITSGILMITSFMPVLQIVILQINGFIFYPFRIFLGIEGTPALLIVNAVLSTIVLVFFYLSEKKVTRVTTAICSVLFLFPFFMFLTEDLISSEPYFLHFFLTGLVIGLILLLVALLKRATATSRPSLQK